MSMYCTYLLSLINSIETSVKHHIIELSEFGELAECHKDKNLILTAINMFNSVTT